MLRLSVRQFVSAILGAVLLAIGTTGIELMTASIPVASAADYCSTTEQADWDGDLGYTRYPANWHESPEGVSSYISVENATDCIYTGSGDQQFTFSWVM